MKLKKGDKVEVMNKNEVPKIRTKQTWHDDKWIMFEKNPPSTSISHQCVNFKIRPSNAKPEKTSQKNGPNLDESRYMESRHDSRLSKRISPYTSSINEVRTHKFRAIEKDGRRQRQAVARKRLVEKDMQGYNQMVPMIRNTQSNSSDSDACSVGSCSITDRSPNKLETPSILIVTRETDAECSDAESGYGSGFERKSDPLPSDDEVEISIRRLEVQAYRRTLEALYASGPLSWEQESMLTNLRIMLHISNDDHLTELKYLLSAKTSMYGVSSLVLLFCCLVSSCRVRDMHGIIHIALDLNAKLVLYGASAVYRLLGEVGGILDVLPSYATVCGLSLVYFRTGATLSEQVFYTSRLALLYVEGSYIGSRSLMKLSCVSLHILIFWICGGTSLFCLSSLFFSFFGILMNSASQVVNVYNLNQLYGEKLKRV